MIGSQGRPFHKDTSEVMVHYNHDLDVDHSLLSVFPTLAEALRDERVLALFKEYDRRARKHKRAFHALGVGSLLSGLMALSWAALSVMTGAAVGMSPNLGLVVEGTSALAVALMIWNVLTQHHRKWRLALFCRERLRQWHFQKFLDGSLIGLLTVNPAEYRTEMDRRWAVVRQVLRSQLGEMERFEKSGSSDLELLHPRRAYADPQLEADVVEALKILRVRHQIGYGAIKLETPNEGAQFTLDNHQLISQTFGAVTLVGAVVLAAISFLFAVVLRFSLFPAWVLDVPLASHFDAARWSRLSSGLSLLLAVWSAGARAYEAGFTVLEEKESYQEYRARVTEISHILERASLSKDRWHALAMLEEESIAELRRFLRIKRRASFLT